MHLRFRGSRVARRAKGSRGTLVEIDGIAARRP
jgi:hypothetical protein